MTAPAAPGRLQHDVPVVLRVAQPGMFAKDGRPIGVRGLRLPRHGHASRRDPAPRQVVHVYDHDWRPARTDIYPGYKSKRPPEPEDLHRAVRAAPQRAGPHRHAEAQHRGWEAEDAIGASWVDAGDDDRIEMVSGDRDLIQLVRDPSSGCCSRCEASPSCSSSTRRPSWRSTACRRPATRVRDPPRRSVGRAARGDRGRREDCARVRPDHDSLDELLADAAGDPPGPARSRGSPRSVPDPRSRGLHRRDARAGADRGRLRRGGLVRGPRRRCASAVGRRGAARPSRLRRPPPGGDRQRRLLVGFASMSPRVARATAGTLSPCRWSSSPAA